MKIAQIAPLYESVPPKGYGGTERVVSYLTEELVANGHEVTLFASGDSNTRARLVAACPRSLRLDSSCRDALAHHVRLLELVRRQAMEFDLLHFHIDYLHYPLSRQTGWPHLTTLHGRLDLPDLWPLSREFRQMPLVSISDAQRLPLPWANWLGTVHHGIPLDSQTFQPKRGQYLAFLGRLSREKRVDRAIEVAESVGMPLRIAAKIDRVDQDYYESTVKPLLQHPLVEFIGEVGGREKDEFLGNAAALLFPIDWPEPFGLVMIEAMACGTPVVAWEAGSVPEVVEHGVTGFVVDSVAAGAEAVRRVPTLDRGLVRAAFEQRFSSRRMMLDYLALYNQVVRGSSSTPGAARRPASRENGQPWLTSQRDGPRSTVAISECSG
jgi:glycosyltransferase involved in cell wall biosynthesis